MKKVFPGRIEFSRNYTFYRGHELKTPKEFRGRGMRLKLPSKAPLQGIMPETTKIEAAPIGFFVPIEDNVEIADEGSFTLNLTSLG